MPTLHGKKREGMALAMAMFAIVVIGALIAGAFFASTQDFRIGSNSLVAQRAFTAAEFGLNKTMSQWDQAWNLQMSVGKDTTFSYATGDGATSVVRATRVNDMTYWLVSEGTAGTGTSVETKRRTSMVMRLAYPAVKVGGALTLAGGGDVKGSSQIYGTNGNPSGWDCANYPGRDTTAIAYAPGTTLNVSKSNAIGSPATYQDPNAGNDGTYVKYGDESWTTLVNNADIKLPGGNPGKIEPVLNGTGKCNTAVTTNWGEPLRTVGNVAACQSYMPIIYSSGDMQINDGRGQGVLLVEGSLTVNGNFQWFGLIIVKDDFIKANGTATIVGAAMARNADIKTGTSYISGNITFQYSKCALESALHGSARLLPAHKRPWAEMW